jgi:hypothetical protein
MPTRVVFLEQDLNLEVTSDPEEVQNKIELQARSGRLLKLERTAPHGQAVWINPSAVAYLEELPGA